jgi:hypothetical protein
VTVRFGRAQLIGGGMLGPLLCVVPLVYNQAYFLHIMSLASASNHGRAASFYGRYVRQVRAQIVCLVVSRGLRALKASHDRTSHYMKKRAGQFFGKYNSSDDTVRHQRAFKSSPVGGT